MANLENSMKQYKELILNLDLPKKAKKEEFDKFLFNAENIGKKVEKNVKHYKKAMDLLSEKDRYYVMKHLNRIINNYMRNADDLHKTLVSYIFSKKLSEETQQQVSNYGIELLKKQKRTDQILVMLLDNIKVIDEDF